MAEALTPEGALAPAPELAEPLLAEEAVGPAPEGALPAEGPGGALAPEAALIPEEALAPGEAALPPAPQLAEVLPAEQAAAGVPGLAPEGGPEAPAPALAEVVEPLEGIAAGPEVNTLDRFVEVPTGVPALGEVLPPAPEGAAAGNCHVIAWDLGMTCLLWKHLQMPASAYYAVQAMCVSDRPTTVWPPTVRRPTFPSLP